MSLAADMRAICSQGSSAERARKLFICQPLQCNDACVTILGAREFTSCPSSDVTPPAFLSTLVPTLVEI